MALAEGTRVWLVAEFAWRSRRDSRSMALDAASYNAGLVSEPTILTKLRRFLKSVHKYRYSLIQVQSAPWLQCMKVEYRAQNGSHQLCLKKRPLLDSIPPLCRVSYASGSRFLSLVSGRYGTTVAPNRLQFASHFLFHDSAVSHKLWSQAKPCSWRTLPTS